ncbi:MAG: 4-alpha-glucanotransferase [Gammaproteobacteria bacterium]
MSIKPEPAITEALHLLGTDDLLLSVHDASFPAPAPLDTGRGTPYGAGGRDLARFARGLGFTGLLLGPQGQTSPVNPSPYDGTVFSRSDLSLDLGALACDPAWGGLLSPDTLRRIVDRNPNGDRRTVCHEYVAGAYAGATAEIDRRFGESVARGDAAARRLLAGTAELWKSQRWLRDDAIFQALGGDARDLAAPERPPFDAAGMQPPAPDAIDLAAATARYGGGIRRYAVIQYILLEQHRAFRNDMQALGLRIYGDVQAGLSRRDAWSRRNLLLPGYWMGAPPSRTNPRGQPWSYPVLDPRYLVDARGAPGPGLAFIAERLGKMLAEFDGLRLDHPHGLVCPWVYRADDPDPYHAVRNGARLFSAPDLPDHPDLARHAIATARQINRDRPRYADDWLRNLEPAQEDRYALVFDALMDLARAHGRRRDDILCEVLSTEPLPLRRVRERHGLGRFRVTQKANLDDPADGYRSENAQPQDWVMVGNHDTAPIWRLATAWTGGAEGRRQAAYLARRLRPRDPGPLADALAADPHRLAHAKLADLFLSPARHVLVFFADLFGLQAIYNVPGEVNRENWTLRVPPEFETDYRAARVRGAALNLPAVLALALRARDDIHRPDLVRALQASAGWRIDTP